MTRITMLRALAVATLILVLLVNGIGAMITPDYSLVANYISELGARGQPWGEVISIAGFVSIGVLIGAFVIMAAPIAQVEGASRLGCWLLFSQAIAYVGAGLAPCDSGCPQSGSISQVIHNWIALFTYIAAGVGFFLLARAPKLGKAASRGFVLGGVFWLAAFALMLEPAFSGWAGLLQRLAEMVLWITLLFIAWRMLEAGSEKSHPASL